MKRKILAFVLIFSGFVFTASAQFPISTEQESLLQIESALKISTIDIYDTIVFDLYQNTVAGSTVSFPVYIMSDDVINAVDFSLKFDTLKFSFDTILDQTTYLMESFYYNPNDFKLRFTSSSLTNIPNYIHLILVRFNMLAGQQICVSDLNTITAYLNGDQCSYKVVECDSTLSVPELIENPGLISCYPNPATDILTIETDQELDAEILSIEGKEVFTGKIYGHKTQINIEALKNGVYFIRAYSGKQVTSTKLVISR